MENQVYKNKTIPHMHKVRSIHFVGIGGAGMCGIAEVLANEGYKVTGSDIKASKVTKRLQSLGIEVFIGHNKDNVKDSSVVVVSSAIDTKNCEIQEAKLRRIPVVRRAEMLGELMRYRYGIAVAGTHGKTTTTSLIASIFAKANKDPTFIIGGLLNSAGTNAKLGSSSYLIAEADESDASFLHLQPMMTVVTNIDADHLDTYQGDFSKLEDTFIEFLHNLPFYGVAVVCLDCPVIEKILPRISRTVITYGTNPKADFVVYDYKPHENNSSFKVKTKKGQILDVKLSLPGLHMAKNATAAIVCALEEGIDTNYILEALASFEGVGRRFTSYGRFLCNQKSISIVDDYGHHPSEIKATIEAIRQAWPQRRIVMIFQPHRYSRTRDLYEDFVHVLQQVDVLLLLEVYSAGEDPIVGIDSKHLCHSIRTLGKIEPHYVASTSEVQKLLEQLVLDNDIVLTQGAGDVVNIAKDLSLNLIKDGNFI